MQVLQVSDLTFGYAGAKLFESVTFQLELGERAGLVAPNGAGKTSLLRLIAAELEPDRGQAVRRKGSSFGYYRQSHELSASGDVLGAFLSGFREIVELRERLLRSQEAAASGTKAALDELAHATDAYHLAHGDALERRVSMLAHQLGFSDEDLARSVASLSGGERGRLNLGIILAEEPDLLLLDEPTNHLDIDTIRWLERYLASYRGAVLLVSHDRAFLDNVTTRTIELGSRGTRLYPLRYSEYVVAREADLERERSLVDRQQQLIGKTEEFIRKNIAGQKTKQAQSRRKMLDKLDRLERPEDVWAVAEKIRFRFAPGARSGDIVLEAKALRAERGGRLLFDKVDLLVRRGERIGIVGPNGAGKTTLLKLLAGRGASEDQGTLRRGTNLQEGYFDQHLGELNARLTAVEEIRRVRGDFTVEAARQYLARFRFWGDDPLRVISGFSGGEQSRIALAKLLLEPRNLLFLDEPTNHLDIPAAEILEEALVGFDGTVLLVSHDRRFLETVTTRILGVRDGRVEVYSGGYRDYAADRLLPTESPDVSAPPPSRMEAKKIESTRTEEKVGREAFEVQKLAAREKERRKKRIAELEGMIAAGEKELQSMRERLRGSPPDDWERLAREAASEQSLSRRVEQFMEEWARLSEESSHGS